MSTQILQEMRALGSLIVVLLWTYACTSGIQNSNEKSSLTENEQTTDEVLQRDKTDYTESVERKKQPDKVIECAEWRVEIYYTFSDSSPNPYEASALRVLTIDKSEHIVNEYVDSSLIGFEFISYDTLNWLCHYCEKDTFESVIWYDLRNDDKDRKHLVFISNKTTVGYSVDWTPDGVYHALDKSIFTKLQKLQQTSPRAFKCLVSFIERTDQELNSEN